MRKTSVSEDPNLAENLDAFLTSCHDQVVTIRVKSTEGRAFRVSKKLLTEKAPYFAKMFSGGFLESEKDEVLLEEIDGVVSEASVATLIFWFYKDEIKLTLGTCESERTSRTTLYISAAIEVARLADMYGVTGFEEPLAESIRQSLCSSFEWGDTGLENIYDQDLASSENLPAGHPVRRALAKTFVASLMRSCDYRNFASDQLTAYPNLAVEIIRETIKALDTLETPKRGFTRFTITDPINLKDCGLKLPGLIRNPSDRNLQHVWL
ncbi:hypothetical protein N7539_005240 [Penicillium diatomitis]|uniref:BTB domain-containing protein n=1 Tax=Penicillium diatomitis TaxID=2819901 RepID=A0A9X0BUT4_9EURO|nr:uncharacterized protein N7539_005240 [Penicillium diatomitis]KAJ5485252.1 hypothetical protein N7539_005240 [Penicillium diatomitis]